MIHLDTSFLIRALARGSRQDRNLRAWLARGELISASCVSWAEFLCGPVDAADIELAYRILQDPVAFVAADAALTARLFNLSGRRRGSLADCMIAATAIREGAGLATTDVRDFRAFEGAGLEIVPA